MTALLLFPDWCAACLRSAALLPETVVSIEGHEAYLYALLAQTVPPKTRPANAPAAGFDPAFAAASLAGTPTVTVSAKTLDLFEATDFPLLIGLDASGTIRVLQSVLAEDMAPGNAADSAISLIARRFPLSGPPPSPGPGERAPAAHPTAR